MSTNKALSRERFGFTVFLSACLHVILIAGVGFTFLSDSRSAPAIEITLAQYRSEQPPEQADFIAQENQRGSGSMDSPMLPSSPFQSEFHADTLQEAAPAPQVQTTTAQTMNETPVVTAIRSEEQLAQDTEDSSNEADAPLSETATAEELSLAIATMQARLDRQQQAYANRPRRHTISSASTRQRHDALYLDEWRRRIEEVGNSNYPRQAEAQEIYGSLRMMVAIRPDGTVQEIRILASSGERILDEAAAHIVRLAAPFAAFPDELRGEVDILEIIRTWSFSPGNSFTSTGSNYE